MNKKYIVHITYVSTEFHPTLPVGTTQIWIAGKAGKQSLVTGVIPVWFIRDYGYSRKCDALKNFHVKNDDCTPYWTKEVKIIEIVGDENRCLGTVNKYDVKER